MKRTKINTQNIIMTREEIGKVHETLEKVLADCAELEDSNRKHIIIDALSKASQELNILRLETFKTNRNGNIS